MREGTRRSASGHSASHSPSTAASSSGQGQGCRVEVHLQRADAGGEVEQSRRVTLAQPLHEGMHAEAQLQVELQRAEFHQQVGVAGRRATRRSPSAADVQMSRITGGSGGDRLRSRRAVSRSRPAARPGSGCRVLGQRRRGVDVDAARSARCRPGLSWPIFQRSAETMVTGQTKPPRLGPSGPSRMGMSPVKSMAPMA